MGMAAPLYYTADMVRALPDDGNRYEVVYGELLVTPAPTAWHEVLQVRLLSALDHYLQRHQCCLGNPGQVHGVLFGVCHRCPNLTLVMYRNAAR